MKKLLSIGLLLGAILGFSSLGVFAKDYKDLPQNHWAYKQIQTLTDFNVVVGYPDGNYRPEQKVTRAEFATMVIKALDQQNAELKQTVEFKDLPAEHWAWGMVERAVMFDLLKGNPDGTFNPNGNVSRGHAISVVVNALTTETISKQKAVEILESKYTDYTQIPEWLIIAAGKAEVLGLVVVPPESQNQIATERSATRAELAAFLVKMMEAAKQNPNAKLKEVMSPKLADGIVIPNADVQGYMAIIPAGTIIPVVVLNDKLSSQTNKVGDVFNSKLPKNLITKERYLLIVENSPITGQVSCVKIGKWFFRDGKMDLITQTISTEKNPGGARFEGNVIPPTELRPFWKTFFQRLFRGSRVIYQNGQVVNVQLTRPVRIDLTNGWIAD